jgi:hypothetical protein
MHSELYHKNPRSPLSLMSHPSFGPVSSRCPEPLWKRARVYRQDSRALQDPGGIHALTQDSRYICLWAFRRRDIFPYSDYNLKRQGFFIRSRVEYNHRGTETRRNTINANRKKFAAKSPPSEVFECRLRVQRTIGSLLLRFRL